MKEIYRILTICCGTPPKPDQEVNSRASPMTASFRHLGGADDLRRLQFTWEFEDKDKKAHKIVTTPREFARVHAGYNVGSTVSVLNDPRNPTKQTYTIERLGNVVGGRPLRYLNMPVEYLKKVAIKMIQVRATVKNCSFTRLTNCDYRATSPSGSAATVRPHAFSSAAGRNTETSCSQSTSPPTWSTASWTCGCLSMMRPLARPSR